MVLSLDRFRGKVAVVTGASAGIGAEATLRLANEGLTVVGLARRSERVEELSKKVTNPKGKIIALKCDLTDENDVLSVFKKIKDTVGPIHILINNAALAQKTSLVDGDINKWKTVLNTNVLGLCICTREAVKSMRENNIDGHIIHVNSMAGHRISNFEDLNVYPASKYAVTALTETLRKEFNRLKLKIKITSLSPGAVETEFLDAAGFDPTLFKNFEHIFKPIKSEDVVDSIVYALSTPPHVQIHELIIAPVNQQV